MKNRSILAGACLLMALVAIAGCGDAQQRAETSGIHDEERTNGQQLRPTDADARQGYDGATVDSYASQGGDFRVWWAVDGEHAPPSADDDGDGIPDYVEVVAQAADDVAAHLESNGWQLALADDFGAGEPPGGDARFDIYLIDFRAGDGHYSRDVCFENSSGVENCAGHFRIENDFAGLAYPSREYAARLVLSHEYFHAVQNAYTSGLPQWWSEGTATWFEEEYNAEQDDFERLTSLYFEEHTRSLNDRGRGPADGFSYGASIFVYFLELQIGADGVRGVFEDLAEGSPLLDAIEGRVSGSLGSLREAFDLFAVYNLFTGSRAISENGYPDAERFAEVEVEPRQIDGPINWNVDADPLAARYLKLSFEEAITLRKTALDGFAGQPEVLALNQAGFETSGAVDAITSGEAVRFEPDMSPLYVVVTNGYTDERRAATLQVRVAGPADDESDDQEQEDPDAVDDDEPGGEGGCSAASTGPSPMVASVLAVLMLAAIRRKRRRD